MCKECCPECGHILSNDRTFCSFCHWTDNPCRYEEKLADEIIRCYAAAIPPADIAREYTAVA